MNELIFYSLFYLSLVIMLKLTFDYVKRCAKVRKMQTTRGVKTKAIIRPIVSSEEVEQHE